MVTSTQRIVNTLRSRFKDNPIVTGTSDADLLRAYTLFRSREPEMDINAWNKFPNYCELSNANIQEAWHKLMKPVIVLAMLLGLAAPAFAYQPHPMFVVNCVGDFLATNKSPSERDTATATWVCTTIDKSQSPTSSPAEKRAARAELDSLERLGHQLTK